jgi:hypothetical protein
MTDKNIKENNKIKSSGGSILPRLLQNRKIVLGTAIAIVVLIIAAAAYCLFFTNGGETAAVANPGDKTGELPEKSDDTVETGEVLPQTRRELGDGDERDEVDMPDDEALWLGRDPFAGPLKLNGIVFGGRGGDMAIIESGKAVYVVSVGETVDELWVVDAIQEDSVLLSSANQDLELRLHHRTIDRTPGYSPKEIDGTEKEDPDEGDGEEEGAEEDETE